MSRLGLRSRCTGVALVLASAFLVDASQPAGSVVIPGHSGRAASPSQKRDLQSLPLPAQASISAAIGQDSASYHSTLQGTGLHADNPNHALAADFTARGVELHAGTSRFGLSLRGYGYGGSLRPVTDVAPVANANRVEYRRGSLTEWYVNGPLGLEQGFTLEAPPGARPGGELLTLALSLSGDVKPTLDANGEGLTLQQADGGPVLRYAGLRAYDSDGRELPMWLEMQGEAQLNLRVDDAGARYPLLIDPLVQTEPGKAKLTASDGEADGQFGRSVAISGDTVVVGAGSDDSLGTAYVFVEPADGWFGQLTETAKLTASDGEAGDDFGLSVSISGDTVVVGARQDGKGSSYVFVKPAGGWGGNLTETAKLTASDTTIYFGWSVAISGDTLVVGAFFSNSQQGSAYVFVEPHGGWEGNLTETAKLTASDGEAGDWFGWSVAISADTLVVGARFDDNGQGSAYVFVEPGGGWGGSLTETAKLTASDGEGGDWFGSAVAIDVETAVVGATLDDVGGNLQQGSAYVFVEPGGGWGGSVTETAKLTASDGAAMDWFGSAVSVLGRTVVVGAYADDIGGSKDRGSAYVFVAPGGGWGGDLTETTLFTARDGAGDDFFGSSVANTSQAAVAGAIFDDVGGTPDQGSAYVLTRKH